MVGNDCVGLKQGSSTVSGGFDYLLFGGCFLVRCDVLRCVEELQNGGGLKMVS